MKMDRMPVMVGQSKLNVPRAVLDPCGFKARDTVDLYARDGVLVILDHRMTVMEMIAAMDQLHQLVLGFAEQLADACGRCEDCGGDGECPFEAITEERISIPSDLLEAAGIPKGAKLSGYPNEEDGSVTVGEANYEHDLTDVPEDILDMLLDAGICIAELQEQIMMEEALHGPER